MTTENRPSPQPSFGARLGGGIGALGRFLLRLLFILVLAVGLGAAVYYGAVYGSSALYRQYVWPVRDNTFRLNNLETMRELDYDQLAGRLDKLNDRLDALEAQGDTHEETSASLQTQLAAAESAIEALQAAQATAEASLETVLAAQATAEASLESLRLAQATTEALQGEMQTTLDDLDGSLSALDEAIAKNRDDLQTLSAGREREEMPLAALRRELQLIKVMELLARSRIFLAQGSPGLAQQDVRTGRGLLVALQGEVPAHQVGTLAEIIARLDAILENLPDAPVSAATDLEVAWQLLLNGLPAAPESATEVTPPAGEATPTPEPTAPVTPAPSPTPEATATP
jgi:hypothetical protein